MRRIKASKAIGFSPRPGAQPAVTLDLSARYAMREVTAFVTQGRYTQVRYQRAGVALQGWVRSDRLEVERDPVKLAAVFGGLFGSGGLGLSGRAGPPQQPYVCSRDVSLLLIAPGQRFVVGTVHPGTRILTRGDREGHMIEIEVPGLHWFRKAPSLSFALSAQEQRYCVPAL